ncbi:MAG: hypothetical protein GX769_01685 [Erysipelothrix sp.]|nr:hypothetical protein [Erysipelothrix sp.]
MELIRALISIFLGLIFIGFIIRLAWPILVFFGVLLLFSVIRMTSLSRAYKNTSQNDQRTFDNSQTTQSGHPNPNVIDAEFTEEEID